MIYWIFILISQICSINWTIKPASSFTILLLHLYLYALLIQLEARLFSLIDYYSCFDVLDELEDSWFRWSLECSDFHSELWPKLNFTIGLKTW